MSAWNCICGRTWPECEAIIESTHGACCIRCCHDLTGPESPTDREWVSGGEAQDG
jgi:hypothetical protein